MDSFLLFITFSKHLNLFQNWDLVFVQFWFRKFFLHESDNLTFSDLGINIHPPILEFRIRAWEKNK